MNLGIATMKTGEVKNIFGIPKDNDSQKQNTLYKIIPLGIKYYNRGRKSLDKQRQRNKVP